MSRNLAVLGVLAGLVGATACFPVPPPTSKPAVPAGSASGAVMLAANGTVEARVIGCAAARSAGGASAAGAADAPCGTVANVYLTTPWAERIQADPGGGQQVSFFIDWTRADVDPNDDATLARLGEPWTLEHPWLPGPLTWTPRPADIKRMVGFVTRAKELAPPVEEGGPPPELIIEEVTVTGGELRGGGEAELVVRLGNRGPGRAFQVVATTRSSLPVLHGLRLDFGTMAADQPKTRRVTVEIPIAVDEPDAMIVVEVAEGRGYAPANLSRRFPIKATLSPRLTATCEVRGKRGAPPAVDAGEVIRLRCRIANPGTQPSAAATVEVRGGVRPSSAALTAIAAKGQAVVELPVQIARDAKLDQHIALEVTVAEPTLKRTVKTTVEIVVRRPKLCPEGRLTREQYQAKRRELRAALDAGELTAAEFDAYDAELVGCLE